MQPQTCPRIRHRGGRGVATPSASRSAGRAPRRAPRAELRELHVQRRRRHAVCARLIAATSQTRAWGALARLLQAESSPLRARQRRARVLRLSAKAPAATFNVAAGGLRQRLRLSAKAPARITELCMCSQQNSPPRPLPCSSPCQGSIQACNSRTRVACINSCGQSKHARKRHSCDGAHTGDTPPAPARRPPLRHTSSASGRLFRPHHAAKDCQPAMTKPRCSHAWQSSRVTRAGLSTSHGYTPRCRALTKTGCVSPWAGTASVLVTAPRLPAWQGGPLLLLLPHTNAAQERVEQNMAAGCSSPCCGSLHNGLLFVVRRHR